MDVTKMIGYKFFKENKEDNSIECIRIVNAWDFKRDKTLKVIDTNSKEEKIIEVDDLKEYTPLKPVGMIMINGVTFEGSKDVIIAGYLLDRIENRDSRPFVVCRQNITDLYYNLIIKDESQMIAGMSMNILNIPQGFDYGFMIVSDNLLYSNTYMIYKDDTVDIILDLFKNDIGKYDDILSESYTEHCKANPEALFLDEHKGWCKNLLTLLKQNNFQSDLDEMMGITTVEFEIEPYLSKAKISNDSNNEYITITDELRYWLSYLYKININKVYVLEYDNDIDFDELKRSRYFVFRDSNNKLYVFVYTINGEYKEAELEEKDKELDFSTKFRINFLDKYKGYIDSNVIKNS